MKAKKAYEAPELTVVPVAMNNVLMWSTNGVNASFYGAILMDEVDSEGFNIWTE